MENRLFSKQVELLYQQARGAALASIATVMLVAFTIKWAVPSGLLFTWVGVCTIAALLRIAAHAWRQHQVSRDANATAWARIFSGIAAFSGLCWGASPIIFAPYLDAQYQFYLSVMVAGICAASLPLFSAVPSVYRSFALCAMLPSVAWGFLVDHAAGNALGIVALVFLGLMLLTSARLAKTMRAAICIQFNNDALIASLEEEVGIRKTAEQAALQSAAEARESQARFQHLAAASREGLVFHDAGKIINANYAFARMLGSTPEALVGRCLLDFAASGQSSLLQAKLQSRREEEYEIVLSDEQGREVPVAISSRNFDYAGQLVRLASVRDQREKRAAEERARYLAQHDDLTGLPNRHSLIESLKQSLSLARRQQVKLGLMMFNLGRFNAINDTLGSAAGDALICAAAERLKQNLRTEDLIARPGGNKFLVVLPYIKDTQDLARAALKLLRCFELPFTIDSQELYLTVSIGISAYPNDGETPEQLILGAETAMYEAKKSGANGFAFYAAEMSALARENLNLENQLRQALENQEFLLHYQPQRDLKSNQIVSVEALVRWNQPGKGMITPLKFIPVAELSGLIVPLGEWVMMEACRQAQTWQKRGAEPIRVGVNVSARQFKDPDFLKKVAQCLETSGLDPRLLELELTESIVMDDPVASAARLNQIRDLGVAISIDDFGTGYSSLSYLKQFPIDVLKIDGSFVRDVHIDPHNAAIVTAILAMSRQLQIAVVAEGIENAEQQAFLTTHGCDKGQGYYFSKPLPADECEKLFTRRLAEVVPLSVVK